MEGKSYSTENKRLAKNTAALYLRQAIVLAIQLFVTRLVLKSLGEIDFGIYSVIGSVVVLFSFLNSAMSTASQRFITFELGCKGKLIFFLVECFGCVNFI